jgi:transcriptional regulator NrdR family protein
MRPMRLPHNIPVPSKNRAASHEEVASALALSKQIQDSWQQLDHELLDRKIKTAHQKAKKDHKDLKSQIRAIRFQNLGNHNSGIIPRQILDLYYKKISEEAELTYATCCEVWELQGCHKSAAFVRVVYDRRIRPQIYAIRNSAISAMRHLARQTGGQLSLSEAQTKAFKNSVNDLDQEWQNRIEIDAKTLELQAGTQPALSNENRLNGRGDLPKIAVANVAITRRRSADECRGRFRGFGTVWYGPRSRSYCSSPTSET